MAKNKAVINPMTGEELKRLSNVLIYGITDEQLVFVHENLPNSNTAVIDCSECFTDIIATAYIAVIINPDFQPEDSISFELIKQPKSVQYIKTYYRKKGKI